MSFNLKSVSGTTDLIGDELTAQQRAIALIEAAFLSFGFEPVRTPVLERLETLVGRYGEEGEKLIFKILKRGAGAESGETDLALRYDLTIPGARVYGNKRSALPPIFKRCQIGPVWRADRPARGRLREFHQCDVDVYGVPGEAAEREVVETLATALRSLGLSGFDVRINSRGAISALLRSYDVADQWIPPVVRIMDKADKIGGAGVGEELRRLFDGAGMAAQQHKALIDDIAAGSFADIAISRLTAGTAASRAEAEALRGFVERCRCALPWLTVTFDPMLARGLDYYTGIIFEIYAADAKGAIAAGGRYDHLMRDVCGFDVPVVGGSIGLERVLLALGTQAEPGADDNSVLFCTVFHEDMRPHTENIARILRQRGRRVYIDMSGKSLSKQLAFANKYGYKRALICGPQEMNAKKAKIRNMVTGEEHDLEIE